jgi:hypothetical protein
MFLKINIYTWEMMKYRPVVGMLCEKFNISNFHKIIQYKAPDEENNDQYKNTQISYINVRYFMKKLISEKSF